MSGDAHDFASSESHQCDADIAENVLAAQAGDTEAFETLYRHYYGRIYGYLKKQTGNSEIAKDLTQDTFCKAFAGIARTNEGTKKTFKSWLFKIATNLYRDYFRDIEHHGSSLEWEDTSFQDSSNDLVNSQQVPYLLCTEGAERSVCERELIEQAIRRVSPQFRISLSLWLYEDLTSHQIAQQLNVTESCARAYISRGRQQFREAYKYLESL